MTILILYIHRPKVTVTKKLENKNKKKSTLDRAFVIVRKFNHSFDPLT